MADATLHYANITPTVRHRVRRNCPDSDALSLLALGRRLASEGPKKTHATPRRVRIQHNGLWLADTTNALYVWEHPGYPYFWLPWAAFRGADHKDENVKWTMLERDGEKGAKVATWRVRLVRLGVVLVGVLGRKVGRDEGVR